MNRKQHNKYLEINKQQFYVINNLWLKGNKYFDKKLGQKLTKMELDHFDMLVNSGWKTFAKQSIVIYRANQQTQASFNVKYCELCNDKKKALARFLQEIINMRFCKLTQSWELSDKATDITRQYVCGNCCVKGGA